VHKPKPTQQRNTTHALGGCVYDECVWVSAPPRPSALLLPGVRGGAEVARVTPGSPAAALGFTGQLHEDDPAEVIIVCEPDLNNNVMGSIHPHGALYERPVNVTHSR